MTTSLNEIALLNQLVAKVLQFNANFAFQSADSLCSQSFVHYPEPPAKVDMSTPQIVASHERLGPDSRVRFSMMFYDFYIRDKKHSFCFGVKPTGNIEQNMENSNVDLLYEAFLLGSKVAD